MKKRKFDPRDTEANSDKMNDFVSEVSDQRNTNQFRFDDIYEPEVDIHEDSEQFEIDLRVPGMNEEDLKYDVTDNSIRVRGSNHPEKTMPNKELHASEKMYGNFDRTFDLPDNADSHNYTTSYKDEILTISIPKKEGASGKVSVSS